MIKKISEELKATNCQFFYNSWQWTVCCAWQQTASLIDWLTWAESLWTLISAPSLFPPHSFQSSVKKGSLKIDAQKEKVQTDDRLHLPIDILLHRTIWSDILQQLINSFLALRLDWLTVFYSKGRRKGKEKDLSLSFSFLPFDIFFRCWDVVSLFFLFRKAQPFPLICLFTIGLATLNYPFDGWLVDSDLAALAII